MDYAKSNTPEAGAESAVYYLLGQDLTEPAGNWRPTSRMFANLNL